jgi:CDP-diacylglycerol---glycerol-3-phosphate 3-phosphatidyltransferase
MTMQDTLKRKNRVWNTPNVLTMFRVALIVPFLYFMELEARDPASYGNVWSFWIFVLASITDYVDGILARRWKLETPLGQLLDPLADKLLITAALVMLAVFHGKEGGMIGVPAWVGTIIIARELSVTGLRAMASAEGIVIEASTGGKWKTTLQFLAMGGLILQGTQIGGALITLPWFAFDLGIASYVCLWIALVLTAWSGIAYFREFLMKLV